MPRLLDRMPFTTASASLSVRGEPVTIRADQIIVWITLTLRRVSEPNPLAIPFPAILDTGYNYSFAIQERQLNVWTGLRSEMLGVIGAVREGGQRIPLREANLWIHLNQPHMRDLRPNHRPVILNASRGIAVFPNNFPRLPILGLRAIAENRLILCVNGPRRVATLRTSLFGW